jgi:hypothetical protein
MSPMSDPMPPPLMMNPRVNQQRPRDLADAQQELSLQEMLAAKNSPATGQVDMNADLLDMGTKAGSCLANVKSSF